MAKSSNIVHQYFKKQFDDSLVLVKVNPLLFKGTEISIRKSGGIEVRELDFDEQIFEDLAADGFQESSPLEFNLYHSGLV
jgi:hypothetical protein